MSERRRVIMEAWRSGTASGMLTSQYVVGVTYQREDSADERVVFPAGYGGGLDGQEAGVIRPSNDGVGFRAWEIDPTYGSRSLLPDRYRDRKSAVKALTGIMFYRSDLAVKA